MVGEAVTSDRLASVGDVFVMEMSYREGEQVEHYRTDNHVTAFDESAHLEWAVAPAGEAVLGWRWRYDVEPLPSGSTRVTLTYDWSDTPAENRRRFGVPLFDETQLAASLDLLATAVAAAHGVGGGF